MAAVSNLRLVLHNYTIIHASFLLSWHRCSSFHCGFSISIGIYFYGISYIIVVFFQSQGELDRTDCAPEKGLFIYLSELTEKWNTF